MCFSKKIHQGGSFFIVNLFFSISFLLVLAYLMIVNVNSEGISCVYKLYTGKECLTCGFTRSFKDYLFFDFDSGFNRNPKSLFFYFFFLYVGITRIGWTLIYFFIQNKMVSKKIITFDISLVITFFIVVVLKIYLF